MMYGTNTVHRVALFLILLTLTGLIDPPGAAQADAGPKPSMEFEFVNETDEPLSIVDGEQMQCEQPDCVGAEPLEEVGPNTFWCTGHHCTSSAYGYTTYNQLVIQFSDGVTRTSNVFTSGMMQTSYRVTVVEEDLKVERITRERAQWPLLWVLLGQTGGSGGAVLLGLLLLLCIVWLILRAWRTEEELVDSRPLMVVVWVLSIPLIDLGTTFSLAPLVTIAVEGVIVLVYAAVRQRNVFAWLTYILAVNVVTQAVLWPVIGSQRSYTSHLTTMMIAEPLIWLAEAGLLYLLRGGRLAVKIALLVSLVLNAVSLGIGLLVPV
jgi:hypothetical protein